MTEKRRMTLDEWKAITVGLLAGAGINPSIMIPPNLKRRTDSKEPCINDACEKLRAPNKLYCSAECCKNHRLKLKQEKKNATGEIKTSTGGDA